MARPPLPLGTAGKVGFTTLPNGNVRARANFRDPDGVVRPVTRYGPSRAAADRRLKEAIRDCKGPAGKGKVTGETRVRDLADLWLAQIQDADLSDGTRDTYRRSLHNHVVKALGGPQVREVDVAAVDQLLATVRQRHGASAAKTARSVAGLLFGLAARYGAIASNPVRDVGKISAGRKKRPRALTVDEEKVLLAKVAGEPKAVERDIADLVEFMLGTGMRVGEALGVRRSVVELDASVLEVNATAVFVKGSGGVLQERTKSDAGWRVIALPDSVVELCRKRMAMPWPGNEHGLLFPTSMGAVRLPANADRAIRQLLDAIGFDWAVPHTFRKTVATRLDEAGLSPRVVADHLGHAKPSMTMDVYFGRSVVSAEAAKALER